MGWKEQGKKRYNKLTDVEGLSPTLRPSALMKNSQENIIVNQPKKENGIKKVGMVGNHQGDEVYDPEGIAPALRDAGGQGRGALIQTPRIAPTIRAEHHNTADVHFVVSGQTSGTSTQPKSTEKGSEIRIRSHSPRTNDPKKGGSGPLESTEHCFTVDSTPHLVMDTVKQKRGKTISPDEIYPALQSEDQRKFNANQSTLVDTGMNHQNSTKETSGQLTLLPYQNTPSSLRDFLAKVSVLLGSEKDLQILEAHSSMKLCESLGLKEPRIYSLRTSKDSSPMMRGVLTKSVSERWMNLGMMSSGRCLTARGSESRRIGSECSLSQILEDNPDPKYYLSEKQTKYIQNQMDKSPTPLTAIITKDG